MVILPDVNVLVYAYRPDVQGHAAHREWLNAVVDSDQPFGVADLILSGFVRVATHPRILRPPCSLAEALEFAEHLRRQPNCVPLAPGPRHWEIFTGLCRTADVKGGLVTDAYLAALAIETGSEFITSDRDYARFPGLRWRHPLDR